MDPGVAGSNPVFHPCLAVSCLVSGPVVEVSGVLDGMPGGVRDERQHSF